MICYGLSLSLGHTPLSFLDLNALSDITVCLEDLLRFKDIEYVDFVNCKL